MPMHVRFICKITFSFVKPFKFIGFISFKYLLPVHERIFHNPSSNFNADIEYYVLIDATAFDDVSSGSYAGINSTTTK